MPPNTLSLLLLPLLLATTTTAQVDCVAASKALVRSRACDAFISYFDAHGGAAALPDAANPTDAQIRAYLAAAPPPSAACCQALRPYIDAGCACNADTLAFARAAGTGVNAMSLLSRGVPLSACNAPAYGPPVKDHCSAAAFAAVKQ